MADQPELYDMSDSRYNPFDETWSPRGFGYDMDVDPENRDIPSSSPYFVTLWEQPRKDTPSTMVVYDNDTETTLTEVDATVSPGANEYRVNYTGERAGLIEFNSAQGGDNIDISYYGLGNNALVRSLYSVEEKRKENTIGDKFSLRMTPTINREFFNRRGREISLSTSLQYWTLLVNKGDVGNCSCYVQIYTPTVGAWEGTLEIVTTNGTGPVVKVVASTRDGYSSNDYQYEPQFRTLFNAAVGFSGSYIQVGLKARSAVTGYITVTVTGTSFITPDRTGVFIYTGGSAAADGTPTYLPDGVTTPTIGSTVWGFSGRLLLWNTGQTFTPSFSGYQGYDTSTVYVVPFTNFDEGMFDFYEIVLNSGPSFTGGSGTVAFIHELNVTFKTYNDGKLGVSGLLVTYNSSNPAIQRMLRYSFYTDSDRIRGGLNYRATWSSDSTNVTGFIINEIYGIKN